MSDGLSNNADLKSSEFNVECAYQYSQCKGVGKLTNNQELLYLDYNEYMGDIHPQTLQSAQLSATDLIQYYRPGVESIERVVQEKMSLQDSSVFIIPGADYALEEILRFYRERYKVSNYFNWHESTYDHFNLFCNKYNMVLSSFDTSKLVYMCIPNNPDGAIVRPEEVVQLLKNNPNKFFILDLSYIMYSDLSYKEYLSQIKCFSNFVYVSSFAKIFPIAGLRMGVVGSNNPEINAYFSKYLNLKMLTPVARRIFNSCLENYDFYIEQVRTIFQNRVVLQKTIQSAFLNYGLNCSLENLENLGGNFFRIIMPEEEKSKAIKLLEQHQILIRDKPHWRFIRISSVNNKWLAEINTRLANSVKL